jgi:hypothetical protein
MTNRYDLMFNPELIQPIGTAKGVANKPTEVSVDIYELFLSNDNVKLLCKNLFNVYQQNGGQSTRDKFRNLVLLLQHKFTKTTNLHSYNLADEGAIPGNYIENLRAINEDFKKLVYSYFKWNIYNPFHDLVEIRDVNGIRRLKKGSELRPEEYNTLDLWQPQITQVSNRNFRNNNKIPVYQAGLHVRNYDRGNDGLKYDSDQSSLENQIHGYDMKCINSGVLNYKSDGWTGFY